MGVKRILVWAETPASRPGEPMQPRARRRGPGHTAAARLQIGEGGGVYARSQLRAGGSIAPISEWFEDPPICDDVDQAARVTVAESFGICARAVERVVTGLRGRFPAFTPSTPVVAVPRVPAKKQPTMSGESEMTRARS